MTTCPPLHVIGTTVFRDTGTPLARFSSKEIALAMQARFEGKQPGYGSTNPTGSDRRTEQRVREMLGLPLT